MAWRHAAILTIIGIFLGAAAPVRADAPSAIAQDARGFGDEQFARMTAGPKPASGVPSLAALYDKEWKALPVVADKPAASLMAWDVVKPSTGGAPPSGGPLASMRLSSSFGLRLHPILGGYRAHKGIDLAASAGSPIYATADGIVSRADWAGGYGLTVQLRHPGGVETRYAHMQRLAVTPGERVRKGETIGYVGSTGRSTGPHLHYEVLVGGRAVNPLAYLKR